MSSTTAASSGGGPAIGGGGIGSMLRAKRSSLKQAVWKAAGVSALKQPEHVPDPTQKMKYAAMRKWKSKLPGGGPSKPHSTLAKQHAKKYAEEKARLKEARDIREERECAVLVQRIQSKREHLSSVQERLMFLQDDNVEVRARIVQREARVLDTVQGMLQRSSRFVGAKQAMNRAHRAEKSKSLKATVVGDTAQSRIASQLQKLVADLDLAVMREVADLKALIHYRDKTAEADREYKERLFEKMEELHERHTAEVDELAGTIDHAMELNADALEARIDTYLGAVLTDQLKVVGADVTIDSLAREDLNLVIDEMTTEVTANKEVIAKLLEEQTALRSELAWNSSKGAIGQTFHRLPSRKTEDMATKVNMVQELQRLAVVAGIPTGYGLGNTRPPYPAP